jgi:hypothetical protein
MVFAIGKTDPQPFQSQHEPKEKKLNLQIVEQIVLVTGGIGITIPVDGGMPPYQRVSDNG